MANKYQGEIEIQLYDIKYPMKIDIGVITEFQSETGKCFMQCAAEAINAIEEISHLKRLAAETGEEFTYTKAATIMTRAVSASDAAHLFYIAAHKASSSVTFEEIQEAILFEGIVERVVYPDGEKELLLRSYPMIFAELMMFAVFGVPDKVKKFKSEMSSPNAS